MRGMKRIYHTIPVIMVTVLSFIFAASCDKAIADNLRSGKAAEQYTWHSLQDFLIDVYLNKEVISSSGVVIRDFDTLRPFLTLTLDGGELEVNKFGRKMLSEMYFVHEADGSLFMLGFADLIKQDVFRRIYSVYQSGGFIEILGFSKGLGVPKSNVKHLIPGPSISKSLIIETFGVVHEAPANFKHWDHTYSGKAI